MPRHHRVRASSYRQPVSGCALLAIASLVVMSLAGAGLSAGATNAGSENEAARLHSALDNMTKLVQHSVKPAAMRLARNLPNDEFRIGRLREPANTAQAQVKIALNELRQMNAFVIDPHYLPAVVAAGRAYMAISGQDPVTGTTVNPEYLGLEPELAADAARLHGDAGEAAKLSASVKRLSRELIRSKRRAQHLEARVLQLRARSATSPQR